MDRKAFMKTMEVFMAVLITFTFVIVFLPRDIPNADDQTHYLLSNIEHNRDFRNCVLIENASCINATIDDVLQGRFEYTYTIFDTYEDNPTIRQDTIRTYMWFFSGNETLYAPKIFKLYYWRMALN